MPGPDTVVEEAPVLVGFLIALVEFLIAFYLLAMLWTYKHTIGAILQRFAELLRFHVPIIGTVDLGGPINALNDSIASGLGHAASDAQKNGAYFLHASARLQLWMVEETAGLAEDVFRWGDWLQHRYLPKWLKGALIAAFPVTLITKLIADQLRKLLSHGHHSTAAQTHTTTVVHDRTVVQPIREKVVTHEKIITRTSGVALPLPWTHVFPRLRDLEVWKGLTRKRLRRLEKIFAAAGAAAIIANALGLGHNWRCVTRGNIGRVARHLCGADEGFLLSLLGDLTAILSVLSVVEFARELRTVEDEAIAIMGQLVREWPS